MDRETSEERARFSTVIVPFSLILDDSRPYNQVVFQTSIDNGTLYLTTVCIRFMDPLLVLSRFLLNSRTYETGKDSVEE